MKDLMNKAIIYASTAHLTQVDKNGENYILHPLRVMLSVNSVISKIVAVLHDVIEDSTDPDKEISYIGRTFPSIVLESLLLLTHKKHEPYMEYLTKIKEAKSELRDIVIEVKLADISDNMNRLHLIKDFDTSAKLHVKYTNAFNFLYRGV